MRNVSRGPSGDVWAPQSSSGWGRGAGRQAAATSLSAAAALMSFYRGPPGGHRWVVGSCQPRLCQARIVPTRGPEGVPLLSREEAPFLAVATAVLMTERWRFLVPSALGGRGTLDSCGCGTGRRLQN